SQLAATEPRLHGWPVEVPEHYGSDDGRTGRADDGAEDLAGDRVAQQRHANADDSGDDAHARPQPRDQPRPVVTTPEPDPGRQPEETDGHQSHPDDGHDPVDGSSEPV